jgi:peptide/nickel transport system ATP-binding protein
MVIRQSDLLTVHQITKEYSCGHKAVDQVSLQIQKGECLGLVGESGCGKSTLARCVLLLEKIDQGQLWFMDKPLHNSDKKTVQMIRKQIQAVFQNPTASLNPKLKIIDSLMEPLDFQKEAQPFFLKDVLHNRKKTATFLLDMVKLPNKYRDSYPHELSGGEKQRVAIARAISIEPSFIVLDEPTASLDVSIQAKILNLLKDLQEKLGLSYLFISHDLAAVNFMSNRIMIMQQGRIVDECKCEELFSVERHPYTKEMIYVFDL